MSPAGIWPGDRKAQEELMRPRPLRPDRLRTLERPFGWIPFRILTTGTLQRLSRNGKLLYFFLCLVADAHGISFYGLVRLRQLLALSLPELAHAREELCQSDLLGFDGRVYQLLSLAREAPAPEPPRWHGDAKSVGRVVRRPARE
jgi:hypothetical protein